MAKTYKLIIIFLTVFLVLGQTTLFGGEEIAGPYGLKAVIIDKNDQSFLAWKLPGNEQLIFVGTIFDGKDNLTWQYSLDYLGAKRITDNSYSVETNVEKQGIIYVFIDPGCSECFKLYGILQNEDIAVRWIPISIDNKTNFNTAAIWLKNNQVYKLNPMPIESKLDSNDITKVKKNNQLYKWLLLNQTEYPTPLIAWTEGRAVKIFGEPLNQEKLKDIIRRAKYDGGIYATEKL